MYHPSHKHNPISTLSSTFFLFSHCSSDSGWNKSHTVLMRGSSSNRMKWKESQNHSLSSQMAVVKGKKLHKIKKNTSAVSPTHSQFCLSICETFVFIYSSVSTYCLVSDRQCFIKFSVTPQFCMEAEGRLLHFNWFLMTISYSCVCTLLVHCITDNVWLRAHSCISEEAQVIGFILHLIAVPYK